jgi:hypothetical protein
LINSLLAKIRTENGLLSLNVEDVFKFKLYKGFTLNDVLNTIDLSIDDIELDIE